MGGSRSALVALVVAVAALAVGAALGGDGPRQVTGARYAFSASSAQDRASGSGAFDRATQTGGGGRVNVARGGTRVEAKVRTWKLTILGAQTTLVLRVEVASSTDRARCPVGTKGVTTLYDDGDDATQDRVRIVFAGGRCRSVARAWSVAAGAERVRVKIEAVYPGAG